MIFSTLRFVGARVFAVVSSSVKSKTSSSVSSSHSTPKIFSREDLHSETLLMRSLSSALFVLHFLNQKCPSRNLSCSFLNKSNASSTSFSPPTKSSTKNDAKTASTKS